MLQARENLMEAIQAFLKKYDQIPPKENSMALLLAEKRFLKIKQALEENQNHPKNIQEFLLKLINDLQILNGIQLKQEEQEAKVGSQYWKPPIFYDDDDDDDDDEESYIPLRDIISELPLLVAIAPDLPITDSLIMEDEHLNTIPDTKSDEENESNVKDLNLTPSESEDLSDNEKLNSKIYDAIIESFSPSHIPVEDSYYLMEEIDIFLSSNDSIPPSIENDDYYSEGDNLFLKELLNNDSLPENESFHFDHYYIPLVSVPKTTYTNKYVYLSTYHPSSLRPPEKPPDDDGIYFDIEPDMGV
nr:hypothetical protein [Tanacetum cinerariifolium]